MTCFYVPVFLWRNAYVFFVDSDECHSVIITEQPRNRRQEIKT